MLTSILRWTVRNAVLGVAFFGASMTLVASSASAQARAARQFVLSPGSQRVLNVIMRSSSPHGQQLVWNALRKIGPQRADYQLGLLSNESPYEIQARLQIFGSVLQRLPAQLHQPFVNGLFQASPEEERMAIQVLQQVVRENEQASRIFAEGQKERRRQGNMLLCALGANPC